MESGRFDKVSFSSVVKCFRKRKLRKEWQNQEELAKSKPISISGFQSQHKDNTG